MAEAASVSDELANTVGTGDAFCAALIFGPAARAGLHEALAVANAVGADAVGDPSSQPDLAQLGHYVERTAPASDSSS